VDEKLAKAFDTANLMAVLNIQKQVLKEEFYQNLIYYHNGGVFTLNKELINFVKTLLDLNNTVDIVLVDDTDTPIAIADTEEFLNNILSAYTRAVNEYHTKFSNLKKSRSVEKLINL
jgi:hypothetical protein